MRRCNVNYCKRFYGNIFYKVTRAKLVWLQLVEPLAFLRIQDSGFGRLEFRPIVNFKSEVKGQI